MALDGAFLYCLREELSAALPAGDTRVDKVHQPSREELILSLRFRGGTRKLYFSTRAQSPRVHFTEISLENPASPPMFCMLLRKRLTGGRLAAIRQPGLERALYFDWDCINELGDPVRLTLAMEIMGRHSNLILLDEAGLVVDALRRVDWDMSRVRPVLPGLSYAPPPAEPGRLDLSLCEPEEVVRAALSGRDAPLSKALLGVSHGLSPLICREVSSQATRGRDTAARELGGDERQRAVFFLSRVKSAFLTGENRKPYLLYDREGVPLEFSFLPITQYGLSATGREMPDFSSLLDAYYAEKDAAERTRQRARDILRVLTGASERISRKLENQRRELAQSGNRETLRMYGDLIHANLHAIPRGAAHADLVNYYDPECRPLRVPLDPALGPAQNAQKYYKDYRKAQTAEKMLAEQIASGERELLYIDSVFDALSRASSLRELNELREELGLRGYLRLQRGRSKPPAPLGPLAFHSDDGFAILVGRNNVQNDRLTLKTARNGDIWLHTKNIPGSHVILVTEGKKPPDSTLEQAAMLAALHSKAAASHNVPVDYTEVRHVKKPSGAPPGMVIYDTNRTAYVTPDPALAERLRGK